MTLPSLSIRENTTSPDLLAPRPRNHSHSPAKAKEWTESEWESLDSSVRRRMLESDGEDRAWSILARAARKVLRKYSTSFFIVTRFLPPRKREAVDIIYAAVRYPDEIVDTFDLEAGKKSQRLRSWREAYEAALALGSLRKSVEAGLPVFAAGFAEVVRRYGIPEEHYHSFLDAMEMDADPRFFSTLGDLIESYVYGSAIVVGYFLTYVYGAADNSALGRALRSSNNLGIALQLTNFLRDMAEDLRRGRLYIPLEMLQEEGLSVTDLASGDKQDVQRRLQKRLAQSIESYYRLSELDLDAFAPDCQPAIKACVGVYRALANRILEAPHGISERVSVPLIHKFKFLPLSKYWRIPLSYVIPRA